MNRRKPAGSSVPGASVFGRHIPHVAAPTLVAAPMLEVPARSCESGRQHRLCGQSWPPQHGGCHRKQVSERFGPLSGRSSWARPRRRTSASSCLGRARPDGFAESAPLPSSEPQTRAKVHTRACGALEADLRTPPARRLLSAGRRAWQISQTCTQQAHDLLCRSEADEHWCHEPARSPQHPRARRFLQHSFSSKSGAKFQTKDFGTLPGALPIDLSR